MACDRLGRYATDAAVVSDLRRATGRFPHDTRLAELIRALSAGNQRFAELWAIGTVAAHREDHKTPRTARTHAGRRGQTVTVAPWRRPRRATASWSQRPAHPPGDLRSRG
ncbi:hypothetical protein [Streptomyces sp. NEAU-S77]|uniref:MmyB family transcriptional regulator n=1 Tax=Streptomyces sp. NEAU-S77 TaxID=3411033 RepID=UPI003BA07C27